MDSADEKEDIFNASADLFDDGEAILEMYSGAKNMDSPRLLSNKDVLTGDHDDRQPLQLEVSSNSVQCNGFMSKTLLSSTSAQVEKITPLCRAASMCNREYFTSSLYNQFNYVNGKSQEDSYEGQPNKRHKLCESEEEVSDNSDEVIVVNKSCASMRMLNVSNNSSDKADSFIVSGKIAKDSSDPDSSSDEFNIDRAPGISSLNEDVIKERTNLSENTDSRNEKQDIATNSGNVMNGLHHLSFSKEMMTAGCTRDIDSDKNINIQSMSRNMSSSSLKSSELICPFCNIHQDSLYLMEIHIYTMHSEVSNDNGEAAMMNQERDLVNSDGDDFLFVCPLCDLDLGDNVTLDLHLLAIHEEHNVQSIEQETCPLCGLTSYSEERMKLHIKSHDCDETVYGVSASDDATVFSASTSPPAMACPVCGVQMTDSDLLISHVESHFNSKHMSAAPDTVSSSKQNSKENISMKNHVTNEKYHPKSHKEIQTKSSGRQHNIPSTSQAKLTPSTSQAKLTPYHDKLTSSSSGENLSYRRQYEQNLERSVTKGKMSVTDYHEQKLLMAETDMLGVDNGNTRTQGLIEKIDLLYSSQARSGQAAYLCSPTDHFSGSYGDKGWGCGYRNFQMLLCCLSRHPDYAQRIFADNSLSIPSIPKIQEMIETAWKMGFDPQGCRQLRGRLVNTSKWIGATEIAATLSSLGIKCLLADFHAPSAPDGTHPRLLEWVSNYFCTQQRFLPPLYLQHQGHSRTIIGVEKDRGTIKLLLFDPGQPKDEMTSIAKEQPSWKYMRTFRRTQAGFRAKQYQIVAVTGFLSDRDYEDLYDPFKEGKYVSSGKMLCLGSKSEYYVQ